jgi:hypothetical protein
MNFYKLQLQQGMPLHNHERGKFDFSGTAVNSWKNSFLRKGKDGVQSGNLLLVPPAVAGL